MVFHEASGIDVDGRHRRGVHHEVALVAEEGVGHAVAERGEETGGEFVRLVVARQLQRGSWT